MTKKQRQQVERYSQFEISIDDKGQEYIAYHSAFGNVKDYSPWFIWAVKNAKNGVYVENSYEAWKLASV